MDIWLHHLALNTLRESDCPHRTLIDTPEHSFQLAPVADAREQLQQLLDWYWQGLQEPLAFFPKSAFEACDNKTGEMKWDAAHKTWNGDTLSGREFGKPEYSLLYRGINPLEEQEDACMDITQGVFGNMFRAKVSVKK